MTVALLRLYAYCISGDGSTLIIICRRGQGRIKTKLGPMLLRILVNSTVLSISNSMQKI